jgi:hypothetical protein
MADLDHPAIDIATIIVGRHWILLEISGMADIPIISVGWKLASQQFVRLLGPDSSWRSPKCSS